MLVDRVAAAAFDVSSCPTLTPQRGTACMPPTSGGFAPPGALSLVASGGIPTEDWAFIR